MSTPLVSVIMAAYNAEKFLRPAIDSILNQTFSDFEFIILNDGSEDSTEKIILSYNDSRIVYIKNETNLKLIKSLNKMIDLCNGKYIARMDADDVSLPNRIQVEFDFLEKNKDIGVCSSFVNGLTENDKVYKFNFYYCTRPNSCRFASLIRTPLSHPASFFRTEILKRYRYTDSEHAKHIEAFVLWGQLAVDNIKMAVILEKLLNYRNNSLSVNHTYGSIQGHNAIMQCKYMATALLGKTFDDSLIHPLCLSDKKLKVKELKATLFWIDSLPALYEKKQELSFDDKQEVLSLIKAVKKSILRQKIRHCSLEVKIFCLLKYWFVK